MRLPIKPMIVMIVDVIMMTSLSVKFLYYILANFFFSPKGMPHITKVMCCFIYLWDLLLKGRLWGWLAVANHPLSEGGVKPEPSRVASLLLLTALLSGKHSHYPAFYFSILVH